MSNPGEWIDFATLCTRCRENGLNRSPRTLRRYYKARVISFRQVRRGARLEFNWKTVERELRALDADSTTAAHLAELPRGDYPPDLVTALENLRAEVRELRAMFAGEQKRKAG